MTFRSAISNGFSIGLRQWRPVAIVYFFQILLALTLGMQVFGVFESSIGQSLSIEKLVKNYDHTVVTDFLKVHGASITPLIGQLRWLALVYLVFAVFLNAGSMACAVGRSAGWAAFWAGGARWFFPFLKIAGVFLGLAALWSAAVLLPVLMNLEASLTRFSTEIPAVWGAVGALVVYFLGLGILLAWSLLARLWKIRTDAPILICLKNGWRVLVKKRGAVAGLLACFAALQIGLACLYFNLDSWVGMVSPVLIFAMFLVQQVYVFFKIQARQVLYVAMDLVGGERV